MDSAIVPFLFEYANTLPMGFIVVALVFLFKRVNAIDSKLSNYHTKDETKEHIQQELKLVEQVLNNLSLNINKLDTSLERVYDSLNDLRTQILHSEIRRSKDRD